MVATSETVVVQFLAATMPCGSVKEPGCVTLGPEREEALEAAVTTEWGGGGILRETVEIRVT